MPVSLGGKLSENEQMSLGDDGIFLLYLTNAMCQAPSMLLIPSASCSIKWDGETLAIQLICFPMGTGASAEGVKKVKRVTENVQLKLHMFLHELCYKAHKKEKGF